MLLNITRFDQQAFLSALIEGLAIFILHANARFQAGAVSQAKLGYLPRPVCFVGVVPKISPSGAKNVNLYLERIHLLYVHTQPVVITFLSASMLISKFSTFHSGEVGERPRVMELVAQHA